MADPKEEKKTVKRSKLRTIKMNPTGFAVDVWKATDIDDLSKCFEKRYGKNKEYYKDTINYDCCMTISSKQKSELKGKTRIVVVILHDKPHIVVHELFHALFHLSNVSGAEIKYKSQEWGASMIERLYKKAQKNKRYREYDYE